MVAAISKDGFLTKGDDPNPAHWTSKEDKKHLEKQLRKHDLHVMGSKTFELFNPKPRPNVRRVVLTRTPEKYADLVVDEQLEFINSDIPGLIKKYERMHDNCVVLGGGSVYRQFIDIGVLDEILITIEPVKNESGVSFLKKGETLDDLGLPKPNTHSLNIAGTVLEHYFLKK